MTCAWTALKLCRPSGDWSRRRGGDVRTEPTRDHPGLPSKSGKHPDRAVCAPPRRLGQHPACGQGGGVRRQVHARTRLRRQRLTGLISRYLNGYESTDVLLGWDFWFALWQFSERYGNYNNYRVTDQGERRYSDSRLESYHAGDRPAGPPLPRGGARPTVHVDADPTVRPIIRLTPDPIDSGKVPQGASSCRCRRLITSRTSVTSRPVAGETAGISAQGARGERDFPGPQPESLARLDREIGVLPTRLRADGRLDRTWIIFTSDNGAI